MKTKHLMATLVVATLAVPVFAHAQGVVGGAERGAREGDRAAGLLAPLSVAWLAVSQAVSPGWSMAINARDSGSM